MSADGSVKGDGWAGILQTGLAVSALEEGMFNGAEVEQLTVTAAKEFQNNQVDAETKIVNTDRAPGIVLYSVSGSNRSSAKDNRKVKEQMKKTKTKAEGKLEAQDEVSVENLVKAGYDYDQAVKDYTAYNVYETSKNIAQQEDVMEGFGNNGGEEFLSFLQTRESLIINKDEEWRNWYDNISGKLLKKMRANIFAALVILLKPKLTQLNRLTCTQNWFETSYNSSSLIGSQNFSLKSTT